MKGQKQSKVEYLEKVLGETLQQVVQMENAMGWVITQVHALQDEVKMLKGEPVKETKVVEMPKEEDNFVDFNPANDD